MNTVMKLMGENLFRTRPTLKVIDGDIYTKRVGGKKMGSLISRSGKIYNLFQNKETSLQEFLKGQYLHPETAQVERINKILSPEGLKLCKVYDTISIVDAYGYDGSVELSHHEDIVYYRVVNMSEPDEKNLRH